MITTKCLSCGVDNDIQTKTCSACGGPIFRDVLPAANTAAEPAATSSRATLPTPSVSIGALLFTVVAILAGMGGVATLSNATMGVGFLAAACCAAIFARIAQSGKQHKELIERLDALRSDR